MIDPNPLKLRPDVAIVPLTTKHAPNMYRWMSDPLIRSNIGLRSEPSLERTIAWITNALHDPSACPRAILLGDRHVGNVVLDRIDNYIATARLSVYIGESTARASGIGRTGICLALVEGFQQMGLHKVWLTVHSRNFHAMNTYARLGFALEGILRDEFWFEGQRIAAFYMGLLRDDFRQLSPDLHGEHVVR